MAYYNAGKNLSFSLVGLIKIKNPLSIVSQIMDSAAKFKGSKDVKLQRPEVKVMHNNQPSDEDKKSHLNGGNELLQFLALESLSKMYYSYSFYNCSQMAMGRSGFLCHSRHRWLLLHQLHISVSSVCQMDLTESSDPSAIRNQ